MSDITKTWVEGEIFTLKVSVGKYDESAGTIAYGTSNVNLTDKDIYVDIFAINSETPVLQKNRVSGATTTGITLDEDSATKSNLLIAFSASDYTTFTCGGKSSKLFEIRIRIKSSTTYEYSVFPYISTSGEATRLYVKLIEKLP